MIKYYTVTKTLDWEEDKPNYEFHVISRGIGVMYHFNKKLSWKGWLRRILRMKKPEKRVQ